ncbi:hypothetical protein ACYSNM_11425 [Myroides sp. LJL116]
MLRYILVVFSVLFCSVFTSCDRKLEVVKSNVTTNLYLIKNTNENNIEEVRNMVQTIVDSTPKRDRMVISFYKYTSDFGPFFRGTSYFINNKEVEAGFEIEKLSDHSQQRIARYIHITNEDGVYKDFYFSNEYE